MTWYNILSENPVEFKKAINIFKMKNPRYFKNINIIMKKRCENCNEKLSTKREKYEGWCEDCNLPERSVLK